ncbi:MAG TPA: acyl-CoA dehydrogenase family protein [Actinomycetota bacterium]|nr:acyl-CoA dehydrogenase family protein [Actinomycetota bacterium]
MPVVFAGTMGRYDLFTLPPEQRQLLDEARRRGVGLDSVAERNHGRVNRELLRALADAGLLTRLFPDDGTVPALDLCVLREGLARTSPPAETALALQGLGGYPIVQSGSEAQKERWVAAIRNGDAVAAFALTEPGHGSDAAALELSAEPDGNGWRLSGEKRWISNAPEADVYVVFARTTPNAGARGVTAFVVAGGSKGLSGQPLDLLAPHAIGALVFDGVPVAAADVLGEMDAGFRVAMRTLDLFRPSVGAFAVGMAQAALDLAATYASDRESMGKKLHEHQAVSQLLAEMTTRTHASRLLVYSAAAAVDRGERTTMSSAMAKMFATESAQFVVDSAIQIHGARALERGHPLERLYREVRAPRIYEGTTEIQREIIARELLRETGSGTPPMGR